MQSQSSETWCHVVFRAVGMTSEDLFDLPPSSAFTEWQNVHNQSQKPKGNQWMLGLHFKFKVFLLLVTCCWYGSNFYCLWIIIVCYIHSQNLELSSGLLNLEKILLKRMFLNISKVSGYYDVCSYFKVQYCYRAQFLHTISLKKSVGEVHWIAILGHNLMTQCLSLSKLERKVPEV